MASIGGGDGSTVVGFKGNDLVVAGMESNFDYSYVRFYKLERHLTLCHC